ncbi:hypothetical protein HG264_15625 [Pseudomonas sp. gcc21]|uniref:hypothetical protein n=1 Tax=Pseudomonas sp. gcc21 TaxID=2726989 RepID=UPI001451EA47|nr:hypothetical protein [Pseudomonas sp. gcc21]QJD60210.1 hypothetical protein HG264_15625 [Pseudomonas sp. gcc21]
MTKLAEFRAAERKLAEQLAHLEALQKDTQLQSELAFNDELKLLMKDYNMPARTVLAILRSAPVQA